MDVLLARIEAGEGAVGERRTDEPRGLGGPETRLRDGEGLERAAARRVLEVDEPVPVVVEAVAADSGGSVVEVDGTTVVVVVVGTVEDGVVVVVVVGTVEDGVVVVVVVVGNGGPQPTMMLLSIARSQIS